MEEAAAYVRQQSQRFSKEALNSHAAAQRKRGRPKVVLATNYEEAMEIYEKYHENTLGVISDTRFPIKTVHGRLSHVEEGDPEAGLKLLREIRRRDEYVPLILDSSETLNRAKAEAEGFHFIDKNSTKLNVDLHKLIEEHMGFGDFIFREGDRGMQIRNNYDIMWKKLDGSLVGTGIFNGDVGTISKIDLQMETVTVIFDDREAVYDFAQLNELETAYAMTVHKSQGSEYRAVVLAAWGGSAYLLNRSVLYTAITRARELLIIVGRQETVGAMVENAKRGRRYSGLKLRLQGKTE